MDKVSGHVYMRKSLDIYRIEVFQYLKDHQSAHIPRIQTFWRENGHLIVIEELISGVGLDYVLENVQLDRAQRIDILRQLCDGLAFLHGAYPQIIHRDLKTSNVMMTDDGLVKIIDYDAAKPLDDAQDKDTVLLGTRGSAAPEQYGFGKCDTRTDIYGLGGIIREMFPEDECMQRIADKATRLDPTERYQTIQQLRAELPRDAFRANASNGANRTGDRDAESFLRRLCQVPGFRTRKAWKMVIALCVYIFIIHVAFNYKPSTVSAKWPQVDQLLYHITFLGAMLSIVDVITNWTGLFSRFPLMRNRYLPLRMVGWCITSLIAICCWAILYAVVAGVLGLG